MVVPEEREVVLPEYPLTPPPLERAALPEERLKLLLPVAGARVTADERVVAPAERVVTPERLPEAVRVVTPERRAEVDLVADMALRVPAYRLDTMLRPAERRDPPSARELPA